MEINNNLIQRMEFQLKINQVSQFDLLSKEIPELVSENLENFIDRSIQELGLDSQFLIIDQLVLDLGTLDISNLKYEIQEKFKNQFRRELEKQLKKNRFTKIGDEDLTFFIFIYFIKNGARPWWLTNQVRHFGEFATQAFSLQPHKFLSYFKFFIKHPTYRKRILDHLGEELLVRVLMQEKRIGRISSSVMIFAIKDFLKKKYPHWSETRISLAFKEIILRIFLYGHSIDQVWKLNLAIESTLDSLHPHGQRWQNLSATLLAAPAPQSVGLAGGLLQIKAANRRMSFSYGEQAVHLQWFQFYLENGYSHPAIGAKAYNFREVNYLFNYLLLNHFEQLTALLLSLGSVQSIKKRFLGSISQELLDQFFSKVAPSKKKLMEWVVDVYQKVQNDYKPINQTFINVKKSLNEITFELFLKKNLNQINDENYLRLLFKQSSRKFGVKYKDLLFFTLKSLASGHKKYRGIKFYEMLSSIYTKDILKNRPHFTLERSVQVWNQSEQNSGTADYQNKEFVFGLILSAYRHKSASGVRLAKDWLKANLQSQSFHNTADVLRLWEIFAAKFGIMPEQIVIPVLVEKHRNPSILLSKEVFNFFKKKYRIQGLFINKKPDESRLIQTLQEHKKSIPRNLLKSILLGLNLGKRTGKIDFQRIANLIHPIDSQWVPRYLSWLDRLLKDNELQAKKPQVLHWFLNQIILLPQRNLTLEILQNKTLEFLQTDQLSLEVWDKQELTTSPRKMENSNSGTGAYPVPQSGNFVKYPQNSTQNTFRLFEILGRSAILAIFPESKKYGDKILLQMLTSKYEAEFLQLLKKHQFDEELQDYLLIQAPAWLKKQLMGFIFRSALSPWGSTVSSLQAYFEKNKWIQLSGAALHSFIEKNLWQEIFGATVLSFGQLAAQQLQRALASGLISPSFWIDLAFFQSSESLPIQEDHPASSQDLLIMRGSDFLSYATVMSRSQVNQASTLRILERILFDYSFPKGHPFEEYQVDEFRSYILNLIQQDRKVLPGLLEKTESPLMLFRFLKLLDEKSLRFVIQENHRKLGFPSLIKKMDAVFSFFRIKEKYKITDFWAVWIEELYLRKSDKAKLPQVYAVFFRILEEEGVLPISSLILIEDWKPLLSILKLEGSAAKLFVEEMGRLIGDGILPQGAESMSISTLSTVPVEEEVETYLRETGQVDPKVLTALVKQITSPALLHRVLEQLDTRKLRFLIQEDHRKLGLPRLLKQLDGVFSHYKIVDESRINRFFVAWIELMQFRRPANGNLLSLYTAVFRVLLAEDILPITAFQEVKGEKPLRTLFQLEGEEWALVEEELVQLIGNQKLVQVSQAVQEVSGELLRLEDFERSILGVKEEDQLALTDRLLTRVKSPSLLLRILKTLNKSTLRFLIEQHYRKLGIPLAFRQLDDILTFFGIREESKIQNFFTAWIGMLHFRKVNLLSPSAQYLSLVGVLLAEGILPKASLLAVTDWKPLLVTLSLSEKETQLFLQDLGKLSEAPKSPAMMESSKVDTKDFLRGRNPADLLYYPSGLSFDQYASLLELVMEKGGFTNSHMVYLREWLKFAAKFESKDYLHSVFQLYFLKNLKSISNLRTLKTRLFYSFLDKLTGDRKDVGEFLSRLERNPTLIQGIHWMALKGVKKEVSNEWRLVWSQVNGIPTPDRETADWQEFIFNLFLASGRSFFENRSDLRENLEDVSTQLGKASLKELFGLQAHPEVFSEVVRLKPSTEIHEYFVKGKDAQLKTVRGGRFLFAWFEEFFKSANDAQLVKFLQLFQRSFYSNSFAIALRIKLFIKGFFRLDGASGAYRNVVKMEMVEMETFFRNSPKFFAGMKPQPVFNQSVGSVLQILQGYFAAGLLPSGVSGLQELAEQLSELKGKDLDRLRVIIHASLQSDRSRQNFFKLLAYLDEAWFLDLIHGDLLDDLDELNRSIKGKARVDFFMDLGIGKKLDRMIFIASQWAKVGVRIKSPMEILLLLVDLWVIRVDPHVVMEVFSGENLRSALLTQLKVSCKMLKKIIEQETGEEEKQSNLPTPEEIEPIDYGEGVSIANAGLILLWPFYGRFFNALGMVGKEGMKGEVIRERAIQLLQYIATGQTVFEEWDLTLNKILCGANPDFPVSSKIELTTEEQELCDKLVRGTVYNWEKMRGTKMETFRETFIQREGRLYYKENRWELNVDNKAYDVLLDTLPWNISMINLSWMKTRITVQWR